MKPWQHKLHKIIYEAETPAGKMFDLALLVAIVLSVLSVVFESIDVISVVFLTELRVLEWFFTILFTVEYALRIICIEKPRFYILSFLGIIDLLSILPTYLSLYFTGAHSLIVIRAIRLLRIFRILKLIRFLGEAAVLAKGLKSSLPKITVFIGCVIIVGLVVATMMYLIEGPENGFTSIPKSFYWAIITLTTVGYGDVVPQTVPGQILATILMIVGYGVIAVPAGIVSVQIAEATKTADTLCCPSCSSEGLGIDASFCRHCGASLHESKQHL